MILTIYGNGNVKKMEVSPDNSSAHTVGIQEDDVLSLSFTSYEYVILAVNDYVDFEGSRYWLQDRFLPVEKNEQEWKYDLKLYGLSSLIKRFLILNVVGGTPNAVFTLTAPAREHVALIVKSINDGFGTTDWKVGEVVDTENLVIDYEGTYCNEGLEMVAKKAEVEYWIDGTTVNLTRCEYGEEVSLGYDKGLTELEPAKADGVKLYTRLFPIGSSRNIDPSKYGYSHLQLPGGIKYVDVNTDKYGIIHHYEQDAFADIYPKRIGTVSSVRSEKTKDKNGKEFTIWYFKDNEIDFNPNEYELPKENKRVSFQSGELQGLGTGDEHFFEVNYDDKNKEFEIITIWPYGDDEQLPGGMLVPRQGDTYISWNIRMPDSYIRAAEQEYRKAVDEYNAKHAQDVTVYKAPTDHVYIEENKIKLYPGRRVRLESAKYFPEGFRNSRILKISQKVNCPSQMDIEIGDALSTGKMDQVSDRIEDVKNYVKKSPANQYEVVKSWEKTPPTDYNLASFKMVLKQISDLALSKLEPDTALGLIKFLGGLDFDKMMRSVGAIDSMTTGKGIVMDAERGLVQADRFEARHSMAVMELIINRLAAMEGDYSFSDGGTVDRLERREDGTYRLWLRKRWEYDFTALHDNDIVYGMINTLAAGGTDYHTSWMRVVHVDAAANTIDVTLYPDTEVPGGKNYPPSELMVITRRGNQVDPERQGYWYLSSSEHCICMLDGVTKPILEEANYSVIVGRLKHLSIFDNLPINYRQSYVYCRGIATQDMMQIDYEGTPVRSENNRGKWSVAEAAGRPYESSAQSYDAVYHYGCKWMCLKTGTTQEPRFGCTDWAMIEGNPDFTIDIESSRGWYFDADRLDTTFRVVGELYNRDVTEHILDADITWTRDTGNPTEDNAWAMAHAEAGKELHLTTADLGPDYMNQIACSFTATALLRDGQNEMMSTITKNII